MYQILQIDLPSLNTGDHLYAEAKSAESFGNTEKRPDNQRNFPCFPAADAYIIAHPNAMDCHA